MSSVYPAIHKAAAHTPIDRQRDYWEAAIDGVMDKEAKHGKQITIDDDDDSGEDNAKMPRVLSCLINNFVANLREGKGVWLTGRQTDRQTVCYR